MPVFLLLAAPKVLSSRTRSRLFLFAVGSVYILIVVLLVAPNALEFISSQFLSIFDPNEASSNARRLTQYSIMLDMISENWLLGIGPGNLFYEVSTIDQNVFDGGASNEVVANNIWLQAMSDGGIILAGLHIALVSFVGTKLYLARDDATRTFSAAWLALILVSGLIGSDFYTPARWVLLAFACLASVNDVKSPTKLK
jgi:O-antigen ligase